MDARLLLVKSITLLYRESQLVIKTENSADLVRTVMDTIQIPEFQSGVNTERDLLVNLKATISEMCSNAIDHEYDRASLLQQLQINCKHDIGFFEILQQGLNEEIAENQLKRNIVNLRKAINNHFREEKINEILNKASYEFKFKRDKIKDINQFLMEIQAQLEPLQIQTTSKDPAVMSDIDIGDRNSLREGFKEVKTNSNNSGILRTGWQDVNEMTQGGFRRGEYWIIPALQHKYKTGGTLSLFCQFAQYNIPHMLDTSKKPLLLRISFEDSVSNNLQFMYQKLKYDETKEYVDVSIPSEDEMTDYVNQRLRVNGYHIKMRRVDPTQWTYKHLCNYIIELEAQGYEVHVCMVDYVGLLPTTGCVTSGPVGTDKRDMIRRIRNFCSPKGILLMTPHQLSTEAKQLIRNGLPEDKFVQDINEKGYYEGCKQLDQEVDGELYLHLFKHNKRTYLSIQRGKHRISSILSDEKKYVLYEFPKGMPIPDDLNGERLGMRKLPTAASNADASLFNF